LLPNQNLIRRHFFNHLGRETEPPSQIGSGLQALQALYPQLGTWLKQHYAGWLAGMFTADRHMPKFMRLSPKRKIPLYNGNLDCRLFLMDMVEGSNR